MVKYTRANPKHPDQPLTVDVRGRRVVFAEVDGDVDEIELVNAKPDQLFHLVVHNTAAETILVKLDTGTVTGASLLVSQDVAVGRHGGVVLEITMVSVKGPTLRGKPSPGLRRVHRMTAAALCEYLVRLDGQIQAKHEALRRMDRGPTPPDDLRRKQIMEEVERLEALVEEGRRLLSEREAGGSGDVG